MKRIVTQTGKLIAVLVLLLAAGSALAPRQAWAASASGVVNVNTANQQQLMLLPGVGQSRARAIIEYRRNRRFSGVEDLLQVKGIGHALLEKIRSQVVTSGKTTLSAPAHKRRTRKKKN